DRTVGLAGRHAVAFREQLEVVDQRFHVVLHLLAAGRGDLEVVDHDRAGIGLQPAHALLDDPRRLAHLGHAHQVPVVAVAGVADRNVEVDLGVLRVGLLLAQVPGDAGTAQHRAGHAPGLGLLGGDDTDTNRALLPDPVVGEQRFVLVDPLREVAAEGIKEVEHRAFAPGIQALELLALVPGRFAVLRHAFRQVAVDATRAVVGRVHARPGYRLVAVHQF